MAAGLKTTLEKILMEPKGLLIIQRAVIKEKGLQAFYDMDLQELMDTINSHRLMDSRKNARIR